MIFTDESKRNWFLEGLKCGFPICCILFFSFEWNTINRNIHEYGDKMINGYIKCPECLEKMLFD